MAAEPQLTPACELAFDVAREGVEADPVLEPPAAMRSFLYVPQLPRRALTVAQRAIDEDPAFRARVAERATEGSVGRAGWLWLHRPEGWDAELAAITGRHPSVTAAWGAAPEPLEPARPSTSPAASSSSTSSAASLLSASNGERLLLTDIERELEGLRSLVGRLASEQQAVPSAVEQLQQELADRQGQVADLAEQLEATLGELEAGRAEAAELRAEREQLVSALESALADHDRSDRRAADLAAELEQVRVDLADMTAQRLAFQAELERSADRQRDRTRRQHALLGELGRHLALLDQDRHDLVAELDAASADDDPVEVPAEAVTAASPVAVAVPVEVADVEVEAPAQAAAVLDETAAPEVAVEVPAVEAARPAEVGIEPAGAQPVADAEPVEALWADVEPAQPSDEASTASEAEHVEASWAPEPEAVEPVSPADTEPAVAVAGGSSDSVDGALAAADDGDDPLLAGLGLAPTAPVGAADDAPAWRDHDLGLGGDHDLGLGGDSDLEELLAPYLTAAPAHADAGELVADDAWTGGGDPAADDEWSRLLSDSAVEVPAAGEDLDWAGLQDPPREAWTNPGHGVVGGRRAVEVPAEVRRDAVAAARYLVSVPDVIVIIDGDAVASLGWPSLAVADRREALVSYLADLAGDTGAAPDVVFDGDLGDASGLPYSDTVRVRLTAPEVAAARAVAELIDTYPVDWPVVVVTDNPTLATEAGQRGAATLSNVQLLDLFIAQ